MLMWILYSPIVSIVVNAILAIFLYMFITNGIDVFNKLYVSEEDATTAYFN